MTIPLNTQSFSRAMAESGPILRKLIRHAYGPEESKVILDRLGSSAQSMIKGRIYATDPYDTPQFPGKPRKVGGKPEAASRRDRSFAKGKRARTRRY